MSDADPVPFGTRVERYEIEAVLGVGGMSGVYRVRHLRLGSIHALKLLTLDRPSVRKRILREAKVQATIRHPHLVAVTDVLEHDGAPALVLEYVGGPTLEGLLADRRLTLGQADLLGRQILRGVAHAHRHGAIHRDLKPANVLIDVTDGDLVAKVTDFGLVKLLEDDGGGATRVGALMGTPAYMSPEQFEDASSVDARTDVWALGAVLYELCTGRRAFPPSDSSEILGQVLQGRFVDPADLVPGLPDRMAQAIRGALRVRREERVGSVEELLALWCGDVPDERIASTFAEPVPLWSEDARDQIRQLRADSHAPWTGGEPGQTWRLAELEPKRSTVARLAPAVVGALAGASLAVAAGLVALLTWSGADPPPAPIVAPPPAVDVRVEVSPPVPAAPPAAEPTRRKVAARPTPAPPAPPPPAPEPVPEPAEPVPAVPAPAGAEFRFDGDVARVYLRDPTGRLLPAGRVPPGEYTVVAYFDGAPTALRRGVRLGDGDVFSLHCASELRMCR